MLEPAMLRPATEAGVQTAPRAALSAVAAARVQRKGPSRLVARIVAQNSSVSRSSSGGGIGATVADGVVGEEIEPPQRCDRIADHLFGGGRLRHIARRTDYGKAVGAQPLDDRGAAGIVGQVIERNLGAAPGEQFDRRQPDARSRTGDQRSLAVEIAHADALVQKSFARTLPGETLARGAAPITGAFRKKERRLSPWRSVPIPRFRPSPLRPERRNSSPPHR